MGASLIVWVVAGLLGWTGASSFAELGTAIPLNGGPQVGLFECVILLQSHAGFRRIWLMLMDLSSHIFLPGQLYPHSSREATP